MIMKITYYCITFIIYTYNMSCSSKIVVFDLDETLGYFVELGMFWDALKAYLTHINSTTIIDQTLFKTQKNEKSL